MENNPSKNSQIKDSLLEIRKITQVFNTLNMFLDADESFASDISEILFDLWNSIKNLKNIININNEEINKINQYYLNLKNTKKDEDILSQEKKEKIKIDLRTASSFINKTTFFSRPLY